MDSVDAVRARERWKRICELEKQLKERDETIARLHDDIEHLIAEIDRFEDQLNVSCETKEVCELYDLCVEQFKTLPEYHHAKNVLVRFGRRLGRNV
tara:strand:+ start:220 stop:507 length:288 start_codon:yes stop_codon:yes gene_type:complete